MRDFHLATADKDTCRQWMCQHGLLAQGMTCPKCNTVMEEKSFNGVSNGKRWRCPPKNCQNTVSLRHGSFFEKSGKSLMQLADLLYYWSIELSVPHRYKWTKIRLSVGSASFVQFVPLSWSPVDEIVVARRTPGNAQGRPIRSQCLVAWISTPELSLRKLSADATPLHWRQLSNVTYCQEHASGATSGGPTTSCRSLTMCTRRSITRGTSSTRLLVCTPTTSRPAGWRARQPSSIDTEWRTDVCRHTWTNTCAGCNDRTVEWQYSTPSSMRFRRSILCSTDASTSVAHQPVLFRATHFLQKKATWQLCSLAT